MLQTTIRNKFWPILNGPFENFGKQVQRAFWRPKFRPPFGMMSIGYGGIGPFGNKGFYDSR